MSIMKSVSFARQRKIAACAVAMLAPLAMGGVALGQDAIGWYKPKMRDQNVEMSMKIKQPFTLVGVGDMLQMVPLTNSNDQDIQYLLNLMQKADVTVANNENTIVNMVKFTGPISHMMTPANVADDWAKMGIDMMTKANNHTWDDGEEGVWADFNELDRVGIVPVGVGRNVTEARLARAYATPKGTVGLVGIYAESSQLMANSTGRAVNVTPQQLSQLRAMRTAIYARRKEVENPIMDSAPERTGETQLWGLTFKVDAPGQAEPDDITRRIAATASRRGAITSKANVLPLMAYNGVTASQMAQLRAIAGADGKSEGDTLAAWGIKFRVTPGIGEYSYDMDQQAERDILREVRTGKQFYDFQVATIHWHQNRYAFQHYSYDHYPAAYEIRFAHDVIDQGADAFVGHGVHTLKGIEIYKGKPIFYGVSNFVVQQMMFHSWRDRGALEPTPLTGPIVGEGENNEVSWAWMQEPDVYKSILTSSHYEGGKLTEVRVYPVDLGQTFRPGSQMGTPKKPSPEIANKILQEVATYSKPFGTKMDIQDGVGIIRVAPVALSSR